MNYVLIVIAECQPGTYLQPGTFSPCLSGCCGGSEVEIWCVCVAAYQTHCIDLDFLKNY